MRTLPLKWSCILSMALFFNLTFPVLAQNVAINSTGANAAASSILDVSSSNKGILIPRISLSSLTDGSTISSPAASLLIYNTNTALAGGAGYYYNEGSAVSPSWVKLVNNAGGEIKSITPGPDSSIALSRNPMGEVSMADNSTGTIITTQNVYYKVSGATSFNPDGYNFTNGGTNNRLTYTGPKEKMFHIACTLSLSSSASNQVIKAVVYKNGSPLNTGIIQTKLGSTGDITSTAIHVMTNMVQNDYLELYVTNTSGSGVTLTITQMNLFCMGVGMGRD